MWYSYVYIYIYIYILFVSLEGHAGKYIEPT